MKKEIVELSFFVLFFFLCFFCKEIKTVKFSPNNPKFTYYGRFNKENNEEYIFDWSGSEVVACFKGKTLGIHLDDYWNQNYFSLYIHPKDTPQNSTEPFIFKATTDFVSYSVPNYIAGTTYRFSLFKRTEASQGKSGFKGIEVDELIKDVDNRKRTIEFYGDSITCGYGNEGVDRYCSFSGETENHYFTYARMLAREVNAKANTVSFSGKGIVRNYGDFQISEKPLPYYFNRTCAGGCGDWNFPDFLPQAVFIYLGTNDFSGDSSTHPSEQQYCDAYNAFLDELNGLYDHNPTYFLLCGGSFCNYVNSVNSTSGEKMKIVVISLGGILDFSPTSKDLGCDWHPSVIGNEKMTNKILPTLRKEMNWYQEDQENGGSPRVSIICHTLLLFLILVSL